MLQCNDGSACAWDQFEGKGGPGTQEGTICTDAEGGVMLMVNEGTRGRPVQPGPRYDCGRRRPADDPRGLGTWHFIKQHATQLSLDPRCKTELARLGFVGELTDRQVQAGFEVAQIYGAFERYKRRRRSTASPSYLRSFGDPTGEDDPENVSAEPLLLPDETGRLTIPRKLTALERKVLGAVEDMDKLDECFEVLPSGAIAPTRALIERLCVEDRRVTAADLDQAGPMLDYIAQVFKVRGPPAQPMSIAITARRPRRRAPTPTRDRRSDLDKAAWVQVTKAMRPDLDAAGIEKAWELLQALKDRDRFRREKGRGR